MPKRGIRNRNVSGSAPRTYGQGPIHDEHEVDGDPQVMEVLDVNGDGRLEVITQRDSWGDDYTLQSPDEHGPFEQLTYSYQDCPC